MALLGKLTRTLMPHDVPPVASTPCFELSGTTMLSRGAARECHIHPEDSGLCIKVVRIDKPESGQEQSLVEWYNSSAFSARNVPFRHMALCFGWVATNRGPGLLVERICDESGEPSVTLSQYLAHEQAARGQLESMIRELEEWAYLHGVPIVETSPDNVLVRKLQDKHEFVLIDGIGGRRVKLKMLLYQKSKWVGRLRMRHRWPRQEEGLRDFITSFASRPDSKNFP